MILQYQSVKEEVLSVRTKVGVFDASHMGEFWFKGEETMDFLEHLLTNNIKKPSPLKAIYSPLCREDGTVIDDLITYKIEEKTVISIASKRA